MVSPVRLWWCMTGLCWLCSVTEAQDTPPGLPNQPASPALLENKSSPPQTETLPQVTAMQIDGPLSLDEAIAFAFSRHGDVLAADKQLLAARERIISTKSNRAPQLSATVGTDYQNGRTIQTGVGGSSVSTAIQSSTLTTGVTLSQNVFDSGRIKYSVRQSRGQAGNALSNIGLSKNSLAYEVATRFFNQLRAERLVEQRRSQVEIAKSQLDQTEAQIAAGTSARSDVFDSRVTYSQAQLDLVTARNDLQVAIANFRGSLGLGSGKKLDLRDEAGTPEVISTEAATLEGEVALALSRRPDILTAKIDIYTGQAAVSTAKIDARPNVTASLGYNLDPRQTDNHRFNLGATLSLPLFNGNGRRADVRAAVQELDAAQIRLAQAQRDAQIEVETAWTQISGQEERVKNAQALVDSAQNALEVAQGRYGDGVGISLDVSVAQTRLFEAQVTLIGAQFDLRLARLDLSRATGNFAWEDGRVPEALSILASASAPEPDTAPDNAFTNSTAVIPQ